VITVQEEPLRDPGEEDEQEIDFASDLYDVGTWAAFELTDRLQRNPYGVLGVAAGIGFALSGAGTARWIAAGLALALREGGRWAAREALRRFTEAPSRTAFRSTRASASSQRSSPD
jgi:hypothetical protein